MAVLLMVGLVGCSSSSGGDDKDEDKGVPATITGLTLTTNNATINVNDEYSLPVTATAIMSNGTTKVVAVTWDKAVSTAAAGTYTFTGSTSGTALTVKFTLTVTEIVKTVSGLFV